MRIGAHESIAKALPLAIDRALRDGAEALQIFSKNQNRWASRPLRPDEVAAWRARWAEVPDLPVMVHDSYLINLCALDETTKTKSVEGFRDELERCGQLGIPYLVFHPGSHLGAGEDEGCRAVAAALDACFEAAVGADGVMPLLEGTAGQGTNLGWRFEHLRDILGASRYPERLGVCLDTCHLFAAGHDWTTEEGYADVLASVERTVGLGRVRAFHLNDAKRELGSRVDRHARIGEGLIPLAAFARLVGDPRWRDTPGVLETPEYDDGRESFADGIAALKALPAPARSSCLGGGSTERG